MSYRNEKYAKSPKRSQLFDIHMEDSLRVATTTFGPSSVAGGRAMTPLPPHWPTTISRTEEKNAKNIFAEI